MAGEAAFPAYEEVLSDPTTEATVIAGVLDLLTHGKPDPSRFRDHARRRLLHTDRYVRTTAAQLLGRIGNPQDAPAMVALLSDKKQMPARAAARALARMGGEQELLALDIWLLTTDPRPEDRDYVAERRDELKQRLDKLKKHPGK
jgi:HEAT repeat protein